MTTLPNIVSKLLNALDDRKREVIVSRFGLAGAKPMTLQAIGDKYGVTRERIRQIEALGLSEVRGAMKGEMEIEKVILAIETYLNNKGGVVLEADLVSSMSKELGQEATQPVLSFIREAAGKFGYQAETPDWHPFWYINQVAVKIAKDFITRFATNLKNKKNEVVSEGQFKTLLVSTVKTSAIEAEAADNYLAISKKFAVSPYGDMGLSEWPEIKPATIRDWSYLVLKKHNQPLHFEEIANKISEVHTKKKQVFTPTVHNELIKDKRFVLVGRGIYGLTDFGYETGTIRDLILTTLKKNGPMPAQRIISLVSEQRMFKKNTVLLHLQDRNKFGKDKDGNYFVTSA